MDAATYHNPNRKFPAYTLRELQATVARYHAGKTGILGPAMIAEIENEIAYRLAGISTVFVVPQIR